MAYEGWSDHHLSKSWGWSSQTGSRFFPGFQRSSRIASIAEAEFYGEKNPGIGEVGDLQENGQVVTTSGSIFKVYSS